MLMALVLHSLGLNVIMQVLFQKIMVFHLMMLDCI